MSLTLLQKKAIQRTAEVTGDFIDYKIAEVVAKSYDNKITKVSINSALQC